MHLPTLPTIFVKDGVERKIYHTIEARELTAAGWVERGEGKSVAKKAVKPAETADAEEKPKAEKAKPALSKFLGKETEGEDDK